MKRQRGFTLIEVLIAMTLLSIMVVLLFASLTACANSWEKGENKIAQVNQAAVVYQFFQRHLATAKPLWNDLLPERPLSFQGKEQTLQFVSAFPASANRAGLQLFKIELKQQQRKTALTVSIEPFYPPAKGQAWRQEEVTLVDDVTQFSLNYFGSEDGVSGPVWSTEWLDKDHQPLAVKINMAVLNDLSSTIDDSFVFPEMQIPLKMMVDNSALAGIVSEESIEDESNNAETEQ